jgi:hypothetical protein
MHELSSLFMRIPTYYNVISCYNHYLQLFMGIIHDTPYFGYNSAEQENHVLCIFTFQEPSQTQIDLGFFGHQYFITRTFWRTRSQWGGQDGQTRLGGAGLGPGHAT